MSLLNSLARQVMQPATIEAVQRIAAHTYRLILGGPALTNWAYVPGRTLNVFFSLSTRAEAASLRKRTYSILGLRRGSGKAGAGRLHVFRWTGRALGRRVPPRRPGAFLRAGR